MVRSLNDLKGGKERRKRQQKLYNDPRWRRARVIYLHEHPLCVQCERNGKHVPATVVDHKIAHNGVYSLFWQITNWQALCRPCHNRKSLQERRD